MKRLYVSTRGFFSTAHFYKQKNWDTETNAKEFGLCFSEFGHGHNYSLDITFAVPRRIAKIETTYSQILRGVNSIAGVVLQDFDHRHLNFTHPDFISGERISTTEVITKVLESSISKQWAAKQWALEHWLEVEFLGVQVWETHLLAASTQKSLICVSRSEETWTALKIQHPIVLNSGESRSLAIAFFESPKREGRSSSLFIDAEKFLKNADGRFSSLENLCCALQENFGHDVLLSTKSDYFLFAGAEGAEAE
ncbi:MAG: 6-carboxytetrahydropterin synthase [Deltaproteobacteria bacterium]|jgi:6-pyruvoyltetrahydropterin/6-carboxytetrahydropterin synthase|nr:6-carboxytetrahydropterin synthase [Deltaproteobacteria bacterium]